MQVGLPRKKRHFDLLNRQDINGFAYLEQTKLYLSIWDYSNIDNPRNHLKIIDLNTFDGNEDSEPVLIDNAQEGFRALPTDKFIYLLASEARGCIIDKKTFKQLFADCNELAQGWVKSSGEIYNDKFYRWVDNKEHQKIEIIDISSKKIIGSIECDIQSGQLVPGRIFIDDLIIGTRPNGNFAIFSIKDNQYVYELDSEQYFDCIPSRDIKFAYSENQIALACNGIVVMIDIENLEVTHHIHCLQHQSIQEAINQYNSNELKLPINDISFAENRIVVSGGRRISYVMCLDLTNKTAPIQWVSIGFKDNHTAYVGGDLIFGIYKSRPVAWDVFSGEMVWQASAGTITSRIQIGDGWLVYSQAGGYIQCFKWNKPYISPHRPS